MKVMGYISAGLFTIIAALGAVGVGVFGLFERTDLFVLTVFAIVAAVLLWRAVLQEDSEHTGPPCVFCGYEGEWRYIPMRDECAALAKATRYTWKGDEGDAGAED